MSIAQSIFDLILPLLEKWYETKKDKPQGQGLSVPSPMTPMVNTGDNTPVETTTPDIAEDVIWLHKKIVGWPITANLSVTIKNGRITLDYDKDTVWPAKDGVNANPWVIAEFDGFWYAATWEWLKHGQTVKETKSVAGSHIKKDPLKKWVPKKGDKLGFMVSGLCRDAKRNVSERSNVVWVNWP